MKLYDDIVSFLSGRVFPIALSIVLIFLLFRQCGIAENAKKEANRNFGNFLAEQDSVKHLESRLNSVVAERAAFQLKYKELSLEQEDLVERLELERKKKPGVIIRTEIVYRDTTILVASTNHNSGDSSYIEFEYNPDLPGTNRLLIGGTIPYRFDTDSTIFPGKVSLDISQRIDLVTGLYSNPSDGLLYIRASTDFPGIKFRELQALNMIDDPETRRALKSARKPFGVGISTGYGIGLNSGGYTVGPFIGIGLSYSPKWLQFGK